MVNALYTMDEMMAKLKVSRETLYNFMKRGIIPFVKLGGQRRFLGSQVSLAIKNLQKSQLIESLRSVRKETVSGEGSGVCKDTFSSSIGKSSIHPQLEVLTDPEYKLPKKRKYH